MAVVTAAVTVEVLERRDACGVRAALTPFASIASLSAASQAPCEAPRLRLHAAHGARDVVGRGRAAKLLRIGFDELVDVHREVRKPDAQALLLHRSGLELGIGRRVAGG